jgi:hypothetical protein
LICPQINYRALDRAPLDGIAVSSKDVVPLPRRAARRMLAPR